MPSDLVVSNVVVPALIAAPCPTPIDVEVTNIGPDPARFPFDVCLTILANPDGNTLIEARKWLDGEEGRALGPGGAVTVRFVVSFPCGTPTAWLRAEADCQHSVKGNIRSNPVRQLGLSGIGAAPWLSTELRLGLKDSTGATTWDPAELCPTSILVVEAKITNRGCAGASASITELTLSDPGGKVLGGAKQVTPAIAAGGNAVVSFATSVPGLPQGVPLASLDVTICADSTGAVTGQCDRSGLCRKVNRPVVTVAPTPPQVSFAVDGPIRPGQEPKVTWRIKNGCSDLGAVTATIQLGGRDVYTSSGVLPVPPLGSNGEQRVLIPKVTDPTLAAAFYAVGTQTLDLRVDATGQHHGPYRASAVLTVLPEPVDASWWTWPTGTLAASWKRKYAVSGTLTNRGTAAIVFISIDIRERPGPAPGTGPGTLDPADVFSANPLATGAPLPAGRNEIVQEWSWTQGPDWGLSGPTSLPFVYNAEFMLQDEYKNIYRAVSAARPVLVSVSAVKIGFQGVANSQFTGAGILAAAAAFLAMRGLLLPAVAAAGLAWTLFGLSIWNGAQALDPPEPDFRYDEEVPLLLAAPIRVPDEAGEALTALARLIDLLQRFRAADEALGQIHGKLLGAWSDGAGQALQLQAGRYEQVLAVLTRSATFLPAAAAAAGQAFADDTRLAPAELQGIVESWRAEGPPDTMSQVLAEAGLPDEVAGSFDQAVRAMTEVPDIGRLLGQMTAGLVTVAAEIESEAPSVLELAHG